MIYKRRKTNASTRNRHSSLKVDTRHCIITYRIRIDEITCQFDGFQTDGRSEIELFYRK